MKIKVGFFAILLFFSLLMTHSLFSLASLLAAVLHELGHLLAASVCRIRMKEFSVGLFGTGLTPSGGLYSYFDEIILCLGGPLSNLFFGSLSLLLLRHDSSAFLSAFIFSSFAYAVLNLLPIKGFDGGRICRALLLLFLPLPITERILSLLSFVCIFSLWTLSIYLLLRTASSLSLFVFSISLFSRLFLSED
ncbi:MAG: M50 family metallopeptidase [Clostridia bacterium]|nr:M50 family metallopeptidase [Clostridia bacterium]